MPHADLDPKSPDTRISIETTYVDRHLIRQLPGAGYDAKTQRWHAPLSWGTCVTLRGLFGDRLEIGDDLSDWSWREFNDRVDPCLQLRDKLTTDDLDETFEVGDLNDDIFPFQRVGAQFMAIAGQALLGDSMGSGKTVQTIRALRVLQDVGKQEVFPALVVCPNSIKYVWNREFERWWPGIRVNVVTGGAAARRKNLEEEADVYVINYDAVRLHSRLAGYGQIALKRCHVCDDGLDEKLNPQSRCEFCPRELNTAGYKTVIADEAHRMKEASTKWTRAVWAIAHAPQVRYRYALTGTPTEKNPGDLWAIMHFVSPTEFPTRTKYLDRYVVKSFNFFGGMEIMGLRPDTRDELFKVLDPRFRRLPKKAVLPQLPDKVYSRRYVDMVTKQEKAYRQMEEFMAARLDDEILIAPNPLVKVARLMQFASAFAEMTEDESIVLSEPSNKIDALEELLDELGDEPLVVFSASKQLVKLANERLLKSKVIDPEYPALVTGDQTLDERVRRVDEFQAGKQRLLLCTIDAAGEGLTMTRASKLCFLNRHWSSLKNSQAEDRIHRIGSEVHESVEIIDILSRGTVEERQREVLGDKLERLEEVVRDRAMLAKLLGI